MKLFLLAQRKAEKRGIKRGLIEDTMINPAQVLDGYGGRKVAHKKLFIDN